MMSDHWRALASGRYWIALWTEGSEESNVSSAVPLVPPEIAAKKSRRRSLLALRRPSRTRNG